MATPATIGIGAAAQIQQEERRAEDHGKHDDQGAKTHGAIKRVEQKVGKPLVRNPGLSGTRVGKRIGVRNAFVLGNVFPGFEMPPDIRIVDIARGQGEQAEEDDCQESVLYSEQPSHRESIIAGDWRAR